MQGNQGTVRKKRQNLTSDTVKTQSNKGGKKNVNGVSQQTEQSHRRNKKLNK